MPCACPESYARKGREEESHTVMSLLFEVGLINKKPDYYGDLKNVDKHTEMLCNFCQSNDVKDYSLELQIWWRDHQKKDAERLRKEQEAIQSEKDRQKALSKLSDYEKKLLGVKQ